MPVANIFLRIMKYANIGEIFVPKVGLADGIIYDLCMKQYGKVRYPKGEPVVA